MMIVHCDSCNTSFRLDPARLKGPKSKVRCTRCGNIFTVQSDDEEFIQVDISDEAGADEDTWEPASTPPPKAAPPAVKQWRKIPLQTIVIAGVLLLAIAAVLIYASKKTSGTAGESERGKITPKTMEQPAVAILDATNAYFLENANCGQIFVVEGETVNESSRPISFILVEGKLFNKSDQIVQVQRCYCGNSLARDELSHWSLTDIQNQMMNREGRKMLNVNVPPGKRVPFTIVFHNLPEVDALGNFGIEVISSKFD